MGWFDKIARGLEKMVGKPNQEDFQTSLTPENVLTKLREFNAAPYLVQKARETAKSRFDKEWLLNSFQFASYKATPENVIDFARQINNDPVFAAVAPDFYDSTTWNHVLSNLFSRSAPDQRPTLLQVLEQRGHMQGVASADRVGTSFYFSEFAEGLSVEDASLVLSRSAAFNISKQKLWFATNTISEHPEFKHLL